MERIRAILENIVGTATYNDAWTLLRQTPYNIVLDDV